MPIEPNTQPEPVDLAEQKIQERLTAATEDFNRAFDHAALFTLATLVADVVEEHPDAATISVIDWEDESPEGEPFDIDVWEVFDADGESIDNVGGTGGAFAIRHHWTIDPLRVDADADEHTAGRHLDVAKTLAWLETAIQVELG